MISEVLDIRPIPPENIQTRAGDSTAERKEYAPTVFLGLLFYRDYMILHSTP